MEEIKRYRVASRNTRFGGTYNMVPSEHGMFVYYEHHKARMQEMQEEIERLRNENVSLRSLIHGECSYCKNEDGSFSEEPCLSCLSSKNDDNWEPKQ